MLEEVNKKNELAADEAITQDYKDYGHHTVATKIPNIIDGLKPIQRRILWALHDRCKNAANSQHKSTVLAGEVLDKYHVSGDSSVCEAIAHLCQPFNFIIPLLFAETNVGDYSGGSPAKPRYLKVTQHKFAKAVYFDSTELDTLNMVPSDNESMPEPDYLIPAIPMALFTGGFGIALSVKTSPTTLSLEALCQLAVAYIEMRMKLGVKPPVKLLWENLSHYLIPDTPTAGLIRNTEKVLEAYKKGDFTHSITADGTMEVTPKSLIIKTFPYEKNYIKIYTMIGEMLNDRKENFVNQNVDSLANASKGTMDGRMEITVKRGMSPFDLMAPIKKLIEFTGRSSPCNRFITKDKQCYEVTPFEVLDAWYSERRRSVLAGYKNLQQRYIIEMRKSEAMLMVHGVSFVDGAYVDPTDDSAIDAVITIFKGASSSEDTIRPLIARFNMTPFQAKYISSITLGGITRTSISELKNYLDGRKKLIQEVQKKMLVVDQTICEVVSAIGKQFGQDAQRRCAIPSFIGMASIGTGRIQLANMAEIDTVISRFGPGTHIQLYPAGPKNKIAIDVDKVDDERQLSLPKEFVSPYFSVSPRKQKFTVGIRDNPRTLFILQGLQYRDDADVKYVHVSDQFLTIDRSGNLKLMQPSNFASRKSVDSTGNLTDIEHVFPITGSEVYVAHVNSNERNIIRINRLKTEGGRLVQSPMGKSQIIHVWKAGEASVITVPEEHLNRISTAHVLIAHNELSSSMVLDLSRRTVNDGRSIVKFGAHLVQLK